MNASRGRRRAQRQVEPPIAFGAPLLDELGITPPQQTPPPPPTPVTTTAMPPPAPQQQPINAPTDAQLTRGIVKLDGFEYNPRTMLAPDGRPPDQPNGLDQELFNRTYMMNRVLKLVELNDNRVMQFCALVEGLLPGEPMREMPQSGADAVSEVFNQAAIIDRSRFTGNIPGYVDDFGNSQLTREQVISNTSRFTEHERVSRALHSDVTLMLPSVAAQMSPALMVPTPTSAATLSLHTQTPYLAPSSSLTSAAAAAAASPAAASASAPALTTTTTTTSSAPPAIPSSALPPSAFTSAAAAAASSSASATSPPPLPASALGDGQGGNRNDVTETLSNIITRDNKVWWNINDGRLVAVRMLANSGAVNESTLKLWDLIYNDGRLYTLNANRNEKNAAFRSRARNTIAAYADSLVRSGVNADSLTALSWRMLPEHIGFLFLKPTFVSGMRLALALVKQSLSDESARRSYPLRQTLTLMDLINAEDSVMSDFADLVAWNIRKARMASTNNRSYKEGLSQARQHINETLVRLEDVMRLKNGTLVYATSFQALRTAYGTGDYAAAPSFKRRAVEDNTLQHRPYAAADMLHDDALYSLAHNRHLTTFTPQAVTNTRRIGALERLGNSLI